MKFKFDIECTPEEARQFLGLPNLAPMQEAMLKEIEAKMQENIHNLDPESFVKNWLSATMQGWSAMQNMMWGQAGIKEADKNSRTEKKT